MAVSPSDRVPRRRRRAVRLVLASAVAGLTLAGGAQTQTEAAPTDQRYLSWSNRPTSTTPGHVAAARTRAALIPRRVAASRAPDRPEMRPFNPPMPVSNGGLTPASAWIGPRLTPTFAPGNPDALAYATTDLAPAGDAASAAATRTVRTPASSAPTSSASASSAAASAAAASAAAALSPASAAPASTSATDPMAPRRDAPIFRLGPSSAAPAEAAAQPAAASGTSASQTSADQGARAATGQAQARYYSVHREAGRQPDPAVIPDPVFFDSVAIDLAAPPETPTREQDAQGRRASASDEDESLP